MGWAKAKNLAMGGISRERYTAIMGRLFHKTQMFVDVYLVILAYTPPSIQALWDWDENP